jgi:hypothetical protein
MISNGGELLCQKNLGKNWALKMKITYLQYLLIKMDVNNKEVWCKGGNKTGGGKENKISVKLTRYIITSASSKVTFDSRLSEIFVSSTKCF